MHASALTQPMAGPPTAQKVTPAFKTAEPYTCSSVRRIHVIHNMGDLEPIIGYFREDCERTMQSGACEVVMAVSHKPEPKHLFS